MPLYYYPGMIDVKRNLTPDTMNVGEKLEKALYELHPEYDSPIQDLFAVDGLGKKPNEQRPLRSKSAS